MSDTRTDLRALAQALINDIRAGNDGDNIFRLTDDQARIVAAGSLAAAYAEGASAAQQAKQHVTWCPCHPDIAVCVCPEPPPHD